MEYKETVKKVIAEVCRLLLGVVFIFSGTVKAVDPMGGAIKIGDYLTSFGLDKLQPFTVLISFNLSATASSNSFRSIRMWAVQAAMLVRPEQIKYRLLVELSRTTLMA